ncbi:uncharacterized protein LOC100845960, partial [Brachypodium distachyon]|uniref:uncharacterized protein LOC100845960 n=1 Tax=Brachypodium distachyon TaxID=15368 RepID=UPI000D0D1E69
PAKKKETTPSTPGYKTALHQANDPKRCPWPPIIPPASTCCATKNKKENPDRKRFQEKSSAAGEDQRSPIWSLVNPLTTLVSILSISSHLLIFRCAIHTAAPCRGSVSGWIPAGEVRKYLDEKLRTCSHDPCKFVGTYEQLREHARTAHLLAKPAHVDISRKRSWDRLEREQEFGDVISAIRSQNPGAIIVGDYVIETREDMSPDEDSGEESGDEWWSPVRDPMESPDNMDGSPRPWPNRRLGSTSIWGDEQHVFHRFLPQPRLPLSDRRTSRTVWQGIRRSSTQSLMRRGFSNQHYRRSSSYHGYRRTILPRPYADDHRAGINRRQDVPAFGLRRRQRLRYTQGRHDTS